MRFLGPGRAPYFRLPVSIDETAIGDCTLNAEELRAGQVYSASRFDGLPPRA
ncbi:MAG: hypothetical protein AAF654_00695 [Myxococcota bacterium]